MATCFPLPKPDVMTMDAYRARFSDPKHWAPYVYWACAQCGIVCERMAATVPGTCPVFQVNDSLIVKFFGELFSGVHSHQVERQCYELLSGHEEIPTPQLVAEGALYPDDVTWRWPFLISTRIPGDPLNAARSAVPPEDNMRLAGTLGRVVRQVHDLPVPAGGPLSGGWEPFVRWLAGQSEACRRQHETWGSLTPGMVVEIEGYLLPVRELVAIGRPPCILHADLTADHLMLARGATWELTGIIDWGDARVGDPLYELVALHIDAFSCDKSLLRAFCHSYGLADAFKLGFPRRMMSYLLLHEFDVLGDVLARPWAQPHHHLDELAHALWDLSA